MLKTKWKCSARKFSLAHWVPPTTIQATQQFTYILSTLLKKCLEKRRNFIFFNIDFNKIFT